MRKLHPEDHKDNTNLQILSMSCSTVTVKRRQEIFGKEPWRQTKREGRVRDIASLCGITGDANFMQTVLNVP